MDKNQLSAVLGAARHEIIALRRRNEILSAKVEVMDLFACVLHTMPSQRTQGMEVDVAWQLEKEQAAIETEIAAENTQSN